MYPRASIAGDDDVKFDIFTRTFRETMSLDEEVKILSDRLQILSEEVKNVGKRPENYGRLLPGGTALLVCDIQVDLSLRRTWECNRKYIDTNLFRQFTSM